MVAYVAIFIYWNYNGASSGGLKQWMLSLRFLIPMLPIVAFAMAHTFPRWVQALARFLSPQRQLQLRARLAGRGRRVGHWNRSRGLAGELAQPALVQAP